MRPYAKHFRRAKVWRDFVLIAPDARVDEHPDIGAVRAFGVAEHAQRRGIEVATGLCLMRERMLAHIVPVLGFVRRRGEETRFGQQPDLQRQKVPEDSRHRNDDVNARSS